MTPRKRDARDSEDDEGRRSGRYERIWLAESRSHMALLRLVRNQL